MQGPDSLSGINTVPISGPVWFLGMRLQAVQIEHLVPPDAEAMQDALRDQLADGPGQGFRSDPKGLGKGC